MSTNELLKKKVDVKPNSLFMLCVIGETEWRIKKKSEL